MAPSKFRKFTTATTRPSSSSARRASREVAGQNSITVVPTLLERAGNFTQSINTYTGTALPSNYLTNPLGTGKSTPFPATDPCYVYNPATGTNVSAGYTNGDCVPQANFNPVAVQLMNYIPLPNYTQGSTTGFGNNFIINQKTYENWDNIVVKVDQQLHAHDEGSVRWLYRKESQKDPFAGSPIGLWGSILHNAQTILGITETHIFNPNLINEFRSGLTRNVNKEHELDAGTNWAGQLGIPGTTSVPSLEQFPSFKPTGYMSLGDSEQEPVTFTTNNFDTNDTLTWNHGKHTAKFGGSMLRIQYYQPTNSEFSGTMTFNGRNSGPAKYTGISFAEFLMGTPSSAGLRVGNVVNHLFERDYAGFLQDDYKILDKLTINLGLRYEYQSPGPRRKRTALQLRSRRNELHRNSRRSGPCQRELDWRPRRPREHPLYLRRNRRSSIHHHGRRCWASGNVGQPQSSALRSAHRMGMASIHQQLIGSPRQLGHILHRFPIECAAHRARRKLSLHHYRGSFRSQGDNYPECLHA